MKEDGTLFYFDLTNVNPILSIMKTDVPYIFPHVSAVVGAGDRDRGPPRDACGGGFVSTSKESGEL